MGPKETMTPFRDFGTDGRDAVRDHAAKQLTTCNWVQAMEGNLDTAHISYLHQFDGDRRHPRRRLGQARLPVERDVVEVLAARPRAAPRGRRHLVRLPIRGDPDHAERQHPRADQRLRCRTRRWSPASRSRSATGCSCRSTTTTAGATASTRKQGRTRRASAAQPVLRRPVLDADHRQAADGIMPRLYTTENHYQIVARSQERTAPTAASRLREPGPHGDRVDGPDLRPHPGAPRHDRRRDHPDAAHPALGGQGPRRGQGTAGGRRRLPRRSVARRRSSSRARTGGVLGTNADPVVQEALGIEP